MSVNQDEKISQRTDLEGEGKGASCGITVDVMKAKPVCTKHHPEPRCHIIKFSFTLFQCRFMKHWWNAFFLWFLVEVICSLVVVGTVAKDLGVGGGEGQGGGDTWD